jgi:hypothetical protein
MTASLPRKPYPGLLNYKEDEHSNFAGRDKDVEKCLPFLYPGECNLLLLHGRTGCGKSSFLRAGLQPAIKRTPVRVGFTGAASGDLHVVRSGVDPMQQIASELFAIAQDMATGAGQYGPGDAEVGKAVLAERDSQAFVAQHAKSADTMITSLAALLKGLRIKPIIVIDQGEEVFTLADADVRTRIEASGKIGNERDDDREKRLEKIRADAQQANKLRQNRYFEFLSLVAREQVPQAKFIVSLRTEYKGELEDCIRSASTESLTSLKSFLLPEMNRSQLETAILRPTLKREELKSASSQKAGKPVAKSDDEIAPYDFYGFRYKGDLAKRIASWLSGSRVPPGGLLPTMQVACLRLYDKTHEAERHRTPEGHIEWEITADDFGALGDAHEQVPRYLAESLSKSLDQVSSDRALQPTEAEKAAAQYAWMDCLNRFVRLEPDGRATTESITNTQLQVAFEPTLRGCEIRGHKLSELTDGVLDTLVTCSILRRESNSRGEIVYTLGHDSLALAINEWSVKHGVRKDEPDEQDANSAKAFADYDEQDLFGEELKHLPRIRILVPRDLMWDHQIPRFAAQKKFADRLGIEFYESDSVSALTKEGVYHETWEALRTQIVYEHSTNNISGRLLVAGEFQSFPPPRSSELGQWTDVLVTDLFVGNSLVGAKDAFTRAQLETIDLQSQHGLDKVEDEGRSQVRNVKSLFDESERSTKANVKIELWKEELTNTMLLLSTIENLEIYTVDEDAAKAFLELACRLADLDPRKSNRIKKAVVGVKPKFDRGDGLYQHFKTKLAESVEPAKAALEKKAKRPVKYSNEARRFMISTAFGRAMATHDKMQAYFGASHLLKILDERKKAKNAREPDLVQLAQQMMLHTLWQIGIPPAKWSASENRATILRLAAVGYYTADYIREATDEYVGFLFNWIDSDVMVGEGRRSGQITQAAVDEATRASFEFFAFEDYPRMIFDLEASRAYSWESMEETGDEAKAAAHEIYLELCNLRAEALKASQAVTRHLTYLRKKKQVDRPELIAPLKLYKQAWLNYRIYNFYDAERFMRKAADQIGQFVETVNSGSADGKATSKAIAQERNEPQTP